MPLRPNASSSLLPLMQTMNISSSTRHHSTMPQDGRVYIDLTGRDDDDVVASNRHNISNDSVKVDQEARTFSATPKLDSLSRPPPPNSNQNENPQYAQQNIFAGLSERSNGNSNFKLQRPIIGDSFQTSTPSFSDRPPYLPSLTQSATITPQKRKISSKDLYKHSPPFRNPPKINLPTRIVNTASPPKGGASHVSSTSYESSRRAGSAKTAEKLTGILRHTDVDAKDQRESLNGSSRPTVLKTALEESQTKAAEMQRDSLLRVVERVIENHKSTWKDFLDHHFIIRCQEKILKSAKDLVEIIVKTLHLSAEPSAIHSLDRTNQSLQAKELVGAEVEKSCRFHFGQAAGVSVALSRVASEKPPEASAFYQNCSSPPISAPTEVHDLQGTNHPNETVASVPGENIMPCAEDEDFTDSNPVYNRTVTQRKVRPSRAAGKSASHMITSLFNNPFGTSLNDGFSGHRDYTVQCRAVSSENSSQRLNSLKTTLIRVEQALSRHPADEVRAATLALSNEATGEALKEVSIAKSARRKLLTEQRSFVSTGTVSSEGKDGNVDQSFVMLETRIRDPNCQPRKQPAQVLRHRELGFGSVRSRRELQARQLEELRPWRCWRGASYDVMSVDWAPDSNYFVAGAVTHSNNEDLQYNRPCNLLLGNLATNTIQELPDHYVSKRRLFEMRPGPTTTEPEQLDDPVYMTVTAARMSPFVNHLYSASEDFTLKIWDTRNGICLSSMNQTAVIQTMDVSSVRAGLLVTGSRTTHKSVQVYNSLSGVCQSLGDFSSLRAESRPEWTIYPECLGWGRSDSTSHLLLGGFSHWSLDRSKIQGGHFCLWDASTGQNLKVTPSSNAIHSAVWHPTIPFFASGGSPGEAETSKGTRTVVRIWDLRYTKNIVEYECTAREIVDLTFHPHDQNIVTAACEDRTTYAWDFRWPGKPLHKLQHGEPILPPNEQDPEKDTGVTVSLWGPDDSLFYSGSSDGCVLAWDLRRHPADVLVRQVAQVGAAIQSGAFSPDGTHLLLGDATAAIHVLSSAPWDPRPDNTDGLGYQSAAMELRRANGHNLAHVSGEAEVKPDIPGIEAAIESLKSDQIEIHPNFGAGKGPAYKGPWAYTDREDYASGDEGRLCKHTYQKQAFSRKGEMRDHAESRRIRDVNAIRKELLDERDNFPELSLIEPSDFGVTRALDSRWTSASKSEDDGLEDDEWWPRMAEEEIRQAKANLRMRTVEPDFSINFLPERRKQVEGRDAMLLRKLGHFAGKRQNHEEERPRREGRGNKETEMDG